MKTLWLPHETLSQFGYKGHIIRHVHFDGDTEAEWCVFYDDEIVGCQGFDKAKAKSYVDWRIKRIWGQGWSDFWKREEGEQ